MGFFDFLKRNKYSDLEIPKAYRIKEILGEELIPILNKIGLNNWDGNYKWTGNFNNEGIKHMFQYVPLKGLSGTFMYGNCFEFIPTLQNNKLVYHKTLKTAKLHLFEMTEGWRNSFQGKEFTDKVSHWNENQFRSSLKNLIKKYASIVPEWYSINSTIKQNIETSKKQIENDKTYSLHSPDQHYILSFLYAKNDQAKESLEAMEQYMKISTKKESFDESVYLQIKNKLQEV